MTRQPVKSTSIVSVGHDGDTLEVEFTNGAIHTYAGVTPEQYADLLKAPSIGKHFAQHVRAMFPHTRIDPLR